ncbi:MAG: glutamate-5-semialdehyde dehydrogenase [Bacteroidales bacterium]
MNCTPVFKRVRQAGRSLLLLDEKRINRVLNVLADEAERRSDFILEANKKDLGRMDISDPRYDRLLLTSERIKSIAGDIRNVATLPFPVGKTISEEKRPNGLWITRVSVPFGVIGIIYEARPNVTFDVFSLCLKSLNACILKGGSDAEFSNKAIVEVISGVLDSEGIDKDIIALLPPGRKETHQLLNAREYVDLIIPRGSRNLIDFVRENATIPVIETGAGICHTYFDARGDKEKGRKIIFNAKTRRVSVCNALDCLIIHESRLQDLPWLVGDCQGKNVIIYADRQAYKALDGKYPGSLLEKATKESFGTEFLSYKMAVKTVKSTEEAIAHILEHGSKHSEAIITEEQPVADLFLRTVDASSVYHNTSTAFTDGAQFGLGAEIGISTQKLHARGPMALAELTTYKWIIKGDGQVRS